MDVSNDDDDADQWVAYVGIWSFGTAWNTVIDHDNTAGLTVLTAMMFDAYNSPVALLS